MPRLHFPATFRGGFAKGWFWTSLIGLPVGVAMRFILR